MKEGQAPLSFFNLLLASFCGGIGAAQCAFGDDGAPSRIVIGMLAAGILFLLLAAWCRKKSSAGTVVLCALLFFAAGALRFFAAAELPASDISHAAGGSAEITGTVLSKSRVKPSADGNGWRFRYLVEAQSVKDEHGARTATGRLYVAGTVRERETLLKVREGDAIRAFGMLRHMHGYQNPGQTDLARQARHRGITARLSAKKGRVQVVPQEGETFSRRISDVRSHYRAQLGEAMAESDADAVFAMLFGGYDGIREELLDAFTATGIVHILSVSGSHITLLASTLAWIFHLMHVRRGVSSVFIVLAIAVYVMLAEAAAPAVRSGIMGVLAAMAVTLAREKDARQALTVAGLSMLFVSPYLLFDISFELSFAATAGLLYIAPKLRKTAIFLRLPRWLSVSLSITLAAQLAVLPILARYFHTVSVSALLANFLVVPILEIVMIAALFAGLAAAVLPFAARFVLAGDALLLGGAYELSRLLAEMPMSRVYLPPIGAFAAVFYYAALMFFLQGEERKGKFCDFLRLRKREILGIIGCFLLVFAGTELFHKNEMEVHFIDVGQGDAALVITPHGRAFMVDTGGTRNAAFDVGGRVVVPYLLQQGIRTLDCIFLTHAHEDHAMGAGGVLRSLRVENVVTAGEGEAAYRSAMGLSSREAAHHPFFAAPAGTEFEIDGVRVEVLFAPKIFEERGGKGNEFSNVYRVSYGKASFLFTGDLIKEKEAALLLQSDPRSTVLKVGHHGSKTSSSDAFLHAVRPKWAVISVGLENSFGHPAKETVASLEARGITVFRTDRDGAVTFLSDGETMRVRTYAQEYAPFFRRGEEQRVEGF